MNYRLPRQIIKWSPWALLVLIAATAACGRSDTSAWMVPPPGNPAKPQIERPVTTVALAAAAAPHSLAWPRERHSATLLRDGRVLVVGGSAASGGAVATAEMLDPSTGLWSPAGNMSYPRTNHTATYLRDGTVLIAGGRSSDGDPLSATEVNYPYVGTSLWRPGDDMSEARTGHTATLLQDGRVLVVGGSNGAGSLASAELFDPVTDTWSPAGAMKDARAAHTATLLDDGRVVIIGGEQNGESLESVELYDALTGQWSSAPEMSVPRKNHTATLLADRRVLVSG